MTAMLTLAGLAALGAGIYLAADCRPNATDRASSYDPRATEWPALTDGNATDARSGLE